MVLKSYLIGPQTEGMQNNVKPFFLPEEAYFDLQDVYIWRDRVRKRFGYDLIGDNDLDSRLRINLGNTDGAGLISVTVPGIIFAVGQEFSIGTEIFTVNALGAPATLLDTGSASVKTFNTTTGALNITTAAFPNTPVFFYPGQPVMALLLREEATANVETVIAFDTQFAYIFNGISWNRLGTTIWTGLNSNFFWGTNYRGSNPFETFFYVVNNIRADQIKYIPNGGSTAWVTIRPVLNSGGTARFLDTCLVLLPFKDRLLAFNTQETEGISNRVYPNRVRYSQNGDPTNPATSWLDDVAGRGGFVDAPVSQQIITAQFIKDHLIVYFERSTWELIYTGNQAFPFRWQQINAELGCESSFSVIGFDTAVLGVGNVGIHNCNGVNVVRIDEKIPDEVYKIHNGNDGPARVYGIRDYFNELVYWSFPDADPTTVFPTRILLYNYRNNTWAFFNDSFTCFGYFQTLSNLTWATVQFKYPTWAAWEDPWNSGSFQTAFPAIIAGNQQGFVFQLDNDLPQNSQSLYITDMISGTQIITIINHNLKNGDYILFEDVVGITITIITSSGPTVVPINGHVFVVIVKSSNTIQIDDIFAGTYLGAGKVSRISNLSIQSKQFNPGTPIGQETRFSYIDFLMDRTNNGEVTLDYAIDTSPNGVFQDLIAPGVALGDSRLFTKIEDNEVNQQAQQQIWHRYFVQAQSEFIQLFFSMNDKQMKDLTISRSQFILHMYLIYVSPTGRLTG